MKIAIGADHIAFDVKEKVIKFLQNLGHEVIDCGCYSESRTHYPIYGRAVGLAVADHTAAFGVVICGTGIGITNAANRVKGVRCAIVNDELSVKWARCKYDANVIGFGALVTGLGLIKTCLSTFLQAGYNPKFDKFKNELDGLISKSDTNPNLFATEIAAWEKGVYTSGEKQPKIVLPKVKV